MVQKIGKGVCVRERQKWERKKREVENIKSYESARRDPPWRSSFYCSCNFSANLKFYQSKVTKTKDSCLECWGRSVPPSAAGAWGSRYPQVLSALKEVSDRSEQALWMEEWTDKLGPWRHPWVAEPTTPGTSASRSFGCICQEVIMRALGLGSHS